MNEKESPPSYGPETRLQKSLRSASRWMLTVLLAFGLGALLIALALYLPSRQKLDKANTDLESANASVAAKTDQLVTLERGNEMLKDDLDSATLHVSVLQALSDVRAASLAVAADDYAGAHLSLLQVSEALDKLSEVLGTEQKDVLIDMQQSAAQTLADVKSNNKSAQSELAQLTKNLVQLQDSLFPNP